MTHSQLVVFDIKTIPDRALISPEESTDKIPKPIHHKVVAIAFSSASIHRDGNIERYVNNEFRSGGTLVSDERTLIQGFWRFVERNRPRLVTWNGRGFDIPVLVLRSLVHGISVAYWHKSGDRWNSYRARYADWHIDLMDTLADYGASPRLSLDETSAAIGLPGKIQAQGSDIEALIEAGRLDLVRAYCECDVLNLFCIFLRWSYLTGRRDAAGHNDSIRNVLDLIERERASRPHLGEFLDAWRASQRPASMFVAVE